jgi:hypothetical protein
MQQQQACCHHLLQFKQKEGKIRLVVIALFAKKKEKR